MKSPLSLEAAENSSTTAAENRRFLATANVFAVKLVGGQGAGKTSLIEASIKQFTPDVRIGVIACNTDSHFDVNRVFYGNNRVVCLQPPGESAPDASAIHEALLGFDLDSIDLLFIEDSARIDGTKSPDLGQSATAAIFSIPEGHNTAAQSPEIVRAASAVVLNKRDLLRAVPFDLSVFRSDLKYLNDAAELFELSTLHGHGLDRWINWLHTRIQKHRAKASHWFG